MPELPEELKAFIEEQGIDPNDPEAVREILEQLQQSE